MKKNVVHLPDEVHAMVKAFCARKKIRMTDWVSEIVIEGARNGASVKRRTSDMVNALKECRSLKEAMLNILPMAEKHYYEDILLNGRTKENVKQYEKIKKAREMVGYGY